MTRIVHVLALGLWFGGNVFFSLVTAPVIFQSFESLARRDAASRPEWLTLVSQSQGTQLAGLAVGPVFPWFFAIQGACGLLAIMTCAGWYHGSERPRLHKARFLILGLALLTVLVGWPISNHVGELRAARYSPNPVVAAEAMALFGHWHAVSLFINFGTIGLVTTAMTLAAFLPPSGGRPRPAANAEGLAANPPGG